MVRGSIFHSVFATTKWRSATRFRATFGARKLGFARRATASPTTPCSRCRRACAGTARSRTSSGVWPRAQQSAGSRGGAGGQPAFLGAVYGHAGGAGASRISLQGAERSKRKSGEQVTGTLDSFTSFVRKKTVEIRKEHGCDSVVYSVELQDGHVKLKAKAKS